MFSVMIVKLAVFKNRCVKDNAVQAVKHPRVIKWEQIHSFGFKLNLSCILCFFNIQSPVEIGY